MNISFAPPSGSHSTDPLSANFLALADPTRRAMIQALSQGERTLTELALPFQISLPAVTKHLRILERAGLIRRSQQAQRKPCTLQAQPLKEAVDWIEQYRADWEARLDRLDAFVLAMHAAQTPPTPGDAT
jgi:DNA-binding transcriptional ArsR family regulator